MHVHEAATSTPNAGSNPLDEVYSGEIHHIATELLQRADHDPILLATAEVIQDLATPSAVEQGITATTEKIASEARFMASYYDLTGRGRREEDTLPYHQMRLMALSGGSRAASEANQRAREQVSYFIRAQQPGEIVSSPLSDGNPTEKIRQPKLQDGPNTAYQMTSIGINSLGDELYVLVQRPVRVEDGQLVGNHQYPTSDPADYGAEELVRAHDAIKLAWQVEGASDNHRGEYQAPVEGLEDAVAIKVMHRSEQDLDQAVRDNKMPRWWEKGAIAVVPLHTLPQQVFAGI